MQNLIPYFWVIGICCLWPMIVALAFHAFMTRGVHIDVTPGQFSRSLKLPRRKSKSGRVAAATSHGLSDRHLTKDT